MHEIFNICCKYDIMDIWHGVCPKKIINKTNPLMMIRKTVETYHLKKDLHTAQKSTCAYIALKIFKDKRYKLEPWLKHMGRFPSTDHRRTFLYSLLDVCNFERQCRNCGTNVSDMVKHRIKDCPGVEIQRNKFQMLMRFYNAPEELDLCNKDIVFRAALGRRSLLKVVCNFLLKIWDWKDN